MLVAVRSAGALHRLLDVLPVFDGDSRVVTRFTLVPGSRFDVDALSALELAGARTLPWEEALRVEHDLILAASPKGELRRLSGPLALLPHGAGFNKTIADDGSAGVPSGLDPHYLLTEGRPWAGLHALAHEEQVSRLAHASPGAAHRAAVVGDPTLDRLLASVPRREDFRDALETGPRRLIVLTSTWGPEALISRRPGLPADLSGLLPYDSFQIALVLHPNEHSGTGRFDLSRQLAPALSAGLLLPRPHEEWAALLVAADAVVTDHGSTALYAAALGRPVIAAYDGGHELIPDSPMARLLAASPRLSAASELPDALRAALAVDTRPLADSAFSQQGQALPQLRHHLYRLLGLTPPTGPVRTPAFPRPSTAPRRPPAFAVRAEVSGERITVRRFPVHTREPVQHLAAEHPTAGQREVQSAAVLWRRAQDAAARPHSTGWTAGGWTAHALAEAPACRTAVAILTPRRCLLRHRTARPLSLRLEPERAAGRVSYADPAAVASAVHAWLGADAAHAPPVSLVCDTGAITVRVRLEPAIADDLDYEL
ncbi:translation initiation factor 2 [Streptomyces qinzhouensis]|uniref:Translation initiation factor 2 n=1 Tax=Streptomyces qinzhouensis TaxID=2599401 RepID=A0A5B8IIG7_9ACTN|nr:translation initiation factor 2 [Streptomyces qinzhouensis]QDY78202.1 translation initiation factor 2 [Streptomyces qinzhouensis]